MTSDRSASLLLLRELGSRPARSAKTTLIARVGQSTVLPKLLILGFWRLIAPTGQTTSSGSDPYVHSSFKKLRFSYFFVSIFVLLLKSPVHSRNSLKHIKLEDFTTIKYEKCDI